MLQLVARWIDEDEDEEEEEEEEEEEAEEESLPVSCRTENGKQSIVELPGAWNPGW
jgi:hypothetical protein